MSDSPDSPNSPNSPDSPDSPNSPNRKQATTMIQATEIHSDLTAAVQQYRQLQPVERAVLKKKARAAFSQISQQAGGGKTPALLTGQDSSAKLSHNGQDYWQAVQYLAPANESGIANVCPWSTRGCRALCLSTSGRLGFDAGQIAMTARVTFLIQQPLMYLAQLLAEISKHAKKASSKGATFVLRLNGTSDLLWDSIAGLAELIRETATAAGQSAMHFQDYSKRPAALAAAANSSGWHVTVSATERQQTASDFLAGMAVVVDVDRGQPLPETFAGRSVIDGDLTHGDLRILDRQQDATAVVLLRAKGKARKAAAGRDQFVKPATL